MNREDARLLREIKLRNAEIGHHFFSPGAMKFFDSKIHGCYQGHLGTVFYTSEQYPGNPRTYCVRYVKKSGAIGTIGPRLQNAYEAKECAQYLSGKYSMTMCFLSNSPVGEVMQIGPALLKQERN